MLDGQKIIYLNSYMLVGQTAKKFEQRYNENGENGVRHR